jgi:TPR repeat protein
MGLRGTSIAGSTRHDLRCDVPDMRKAFLRPWLSRRSKSALKAATEQPTPLSEDADSQFKLAWSLASADAPPDDYAQAAELYLKAARQGHSAAQFNLGLMYRQGRGVLRSEATAEMWLREAAGLGHAGAQYHIGVGQHRASKRVRQSAEASECRIEAFKWLRLAVVNGYRGAQSALEFVALAMTRKEVDEGDRRALAFLADFPSPSRRALPLANNSFTAGSP